VNECWSSELHVHVVRQKVAKECVGSCAWRNLLDVMFDERMVRRPTAEEADLMCDSELAGGCNAALKMILTVK